MVASTRAMSQAWGRRADRVLRSGTSRFMARGLLGRSCEKKSARGKPKNKPRTKFGRDKRSRGTTRQPGLRGHPDSPWLIHAAWLTHAPRKRTQESWTTFFGGARQLVRGHRPAGTAPSGTRGWRTPSWRTNWRALGFFFRDERA